MRRPLLPPVDEVSVLDGLDDHEVNYDPALAPEDGRPEGPLPTPAEGRNGLILAPTGARPSPADRLAPHWVHPGA